MKLAIDGGKPAVIGSLDRYNSIGNDEAYAAFDAVGGGPLSGYLGGGRKGGYHVEALEQRWCEIFGVKHAVACNSATSGLLMACMACEIPPRNTVLTTAYTMSGTAAPARLLGANVFFSDIEDQTFCLAKEYEDDEAYFGNDAVIITNLFGHPAELSRWRRLADDRSFYLIEDNAQSFGAMEYGKYAGTIGHMGVFSLNVHKQIQAGEGGVVVTQDDDLAERLRLARNHGELAGGPPSLNLRMTEVTAAIALQQLSRQRHKEIIAERIEIAQTMTALVAGIDGIEPPKVREGCVSTWYVWAIKVDPEKRQRFVDAMVAEGVPLKAGYVTPLYKLPTFKDCPHDCPTTEAVERSIVTYENCGWTPTAAQLEQFGEAFRKVGDALGLSA